MKCIRCKETEVTLPSTNLCDRCYVDGFIEALKAAREKRLSDEQIEEEGIHGQ
jgi:hypothetical protein